MFVSQAMDYDGLYDSKSSESETTFVNYMRPRGRPRH